MQDAIIIIILSVLLTGAVIYLIRQKKQGAKCIGCPYSKECGGKCNSHSAESKK